jgi:hypothetical protein
MNPKHRPNIAAPIVPSDVSDAFMRSIEKWREGAAKDFAYENRAWLLDGICNPALLRWEPEYRDRFLHAVELDRMLIARLLSVVQGRQEKLSLPKFLEGRPDLHRPKIAESIDDFQQRVLKAYKNANPVRYYNQTGDTVNKALDELAKRAKRRGYTQEVPPEDALGIFLQRNPDLCALSWRIEEECDGQTIKRRTRIRPTGKARRETRTERAEAVADVYNSMHPEAPVTTRSMSEALDAFAPLTRHRRKR